MFFFLDHCIVSWSWGGCWRIPAHRQRQNIPLNESEGVLAPPSTTRTPSMSVLGLKQRSIHFSAQCPTTTEYHRPSLKNDSPKWSTHGKLGIIKIIDEKGCNENTPGMYVKDTESSKQIRPEITTLKLMTPNCHLPPGSSVTRLPWWQQDMVCKLSKTFMLHDVAIQDKWTITD